MELVPYKWEITYIYIYIYIYNIYIYIYIYIYIEKRERWFQGGFYKDLYILYRKFHTSKLILKKINLKEKMSSIQKRLNALQHFRVLRLMSRSNHQLSFTLKQLRHFFMDLFKIQLGGPSASLKNELRKPQSFPFEITRRL